MNKILTSFLISLFFFSFSIIFNDVYAGPPDESATYVGSDTCGPCHMDKYISLKDRPAVVRVISDSTLTNDADKNGINDFEDGLILDGTHEFDADFSTIGSAGFPPILAKNGNDFTITIGEVSYKIVHVLGHYWKLLFMTTIGNSNYMLPVQYNVNTNRYRVYHEEMWYEINNGTITKPLYSEGDTPVSKGHTGDSWQTLCMGCHVTGLTTMTQNIDKEWLGSYGNHFSEFGTKCEACHGAGSQHAEGAFANEDKKIVNPDKLEDSKLELSVCGRCHVRGLSTGGIHRFPWDDINDKPCLSGNKVEDFFIDKGDRWHDGTSKGNYQQYMDFSLSVMFNKVKTEMVCWDCHMPHGSENKFNLILPPDDNSLCLSCHENINGFIDNTSIMAHTHHSYNPDIGLSRCTKCHMPLVINSAEDYDINAHTFEAITPERTLKLGMPNSCMLSCHTKMTIDEVTYTNDNLSDWTQDSDKAIAAYLDGYAQNWWGSIMPKAKIGVDNVMYSKEEELTIKLGVENPTVRLMKSQLVLLLLTPSNQLKFFPAWSSQFSGIQYTLPYFFYLPLTGVIPYKLGSEAGTYFLGFTILSPESNISNLIFYSDFNIESGSITMFNVQ